VTASLTDRYVAAVLRAVPGTQRPDLEPEIRALVADTTDAKAGDARAALGELGDPNALAARYAGTPQYLIGPTVFPAWTQLVTTLVAILVPIIAIVSFGASMLSSDAIGQAIVSALGGAFMVAVQTVFWVTLVFAFVERGTDVQGLAIGKDWTPESLPDLPDDGRMGIGEMAGSVVANLLLIGALLWVQLQPPITIDDSTYPLFDPGLWSFWLPYFIVLAVVEIGLAIVIWLRGRWTYPLAAINALLGAAFAIPAVWLWQNDLLLNPALIDAISVEVPGDWLGITGIITVIVVVSIVTWDAVDGFLKARRAAQPSAIAGTAR
jgi:hypothetical protein